MRTVQNLARCALLALSVIAVFLLSAGISHLKLRPGVPFWQIWQFLVGQLQMGIAPITSPLPGSQLLIDIYRIFFTIALACFPFAVIIIMLSPELRRRVLRTMLALLVLFTAVTMVLSKQMQEPAGLETNTLNQMIPGATSDEASIDESFDPERISPWIARALSLTGAILIAGVAVGIINAVHRSRAEARTLRQIATRARTAIVDISQGNDFRNVIIQCYADMSRVVRERRGLRRDRSVTAREFTDYLLRANLPSDAVIQLTHLFEKVRYGTNKTTPEEEQSAIRSLEAIIKACEETS